MAEEKTQKIRKQPGSQIGQVLSNKMNKTVVVGVTRLFRHPIYKKYVRRHVKYKAHDQENVCQVGDKVEIVESRPLSKTKRWKVRRVIERVKV